MAEKSSARGYIYWCILPKKHHGKHHGEAPGAILAPPLSWSNDGP